MVSLFECSVFHSDSLKHKATVGKDTLNIKQAVCCSEVGQVDVIANSKQDRHLDELSHRRSFVPNNVSFVGLTGIWISFVCVVQLLTLANNFPIQNLSGQILNSI